jgi:spermidine/putrescine transport system permease protein
MILARLLIAPVIAWLLIFVVAPTLILFVFSFCQSDEYGRVRYIFTLENYRRLAEPQNVTIAIRSLEYAAITTIACAVLAYPLAFQIGRASRTVRDWLLLAVMIPFWTSFVIRAYAWITILSSGGLISAKLQSMHLIAGPLDMLYSPRAVVLGLVYTYLPFMILPIYAAVEKLDGAMIEAALDLGANPFQTFWRVVLPLTWSGVAGGIVLVFIPAVGMFAVSDLLGGRKYLMIGNVIEQKFEAGHDQPMGSAMGMALLLAFGGAMALLGGTAERRKRRATSPATPV